MTAPISDGNGRLLLTIRVYERATDLKVHRSMNERIAGRAIMAVVHELGILTHSMLEKMGALK